MNNKRRLTADIRLRCYAPPTKFSKAELRMFTGCSPKSPQVIVENANMLNNKKKL